MTSYQQGNLLLWIKNYKTINSIWIFNLPTWYWNWTFLFCQNIHGSGLRILPQDQRIWVTSVFEIRGGLWANGLHWCAFAHVSHILEGVNNLRLFAVALSGLVLRFLWFILKNRGFRLKFGLNFMHVDFEFCISIQLIDFELWIVPTINERVYNSQRGVLSRLKKKLWKKQLSVSFKKHWRKLW